MATLIFNIIMAILFIAVIYLKYMAKERIKKGMNLGFIKVSIEYFEVFLGIGFMALAFTSYRSDASIYDVNFISLLLYMGFFIWSLDFRNATLKALNRKFSGNTLINEEAMEMSIDCRRGEIYLLDMKFKARCYDFNPIPEGKYLKILYFDNDLEVVVEVV